MADLASPYIYGDGYIFLPVEITGLPAILELDGAKFQVKSEFHASLIATKLVAPEYAKRAQISEPEAKKAVAAAAFEIINAVKPTVKAIGPELRLADQPDRGRRTIIAMAEIDGLEEAFARLNSRLGLNLRTQVGHITLATIGGPIGIPSAYALERWTKPLTSAQLDQLHPQIKLENLFGAPK